MWRTSGRSLTQKAANARGGQMQTGWRKGRISLSGLKGLHVEELTPILLGVAKTEEMKEN